MTDNEKTLLAADILTIVDHHRKTWKNDPAKSQVMTELRNGWSASGILKRKWSLGGNFEALAYDLGFLVWQDGRAVRIGLAEDHANENIETVYITGGN